MPTYYFAIKYTDHVVPDLEGESFSDLVSAKEEACASLRELVAKAIMSKKADIPEAIEICDAVGRLVAEVQIDAAIPQIMLRNLQR